MIIIVNSDTFSHSNEKLIFVKKTQSVFVRYDINRCRLGIDIY
jgi:hypothetical protein